MLAKNNYEKSFVKMSFLSEKELMIFFGFISVQNFGMIDA